MQMRMSRNIGIRCRRYPFRELARGSPEGGAEAVSLAPDRPVAGQGRGCKMAPIGRFVESSTPRATFRYDQDADDS